MQRQKTNAAMTLAKMFGFNNSLARRTSVRRRIIVLALGLTLIVVPLLSGHSPITPPAQAQIDIGTCVGPTRIFQGCPMGGPYEVALENKVINKLIETHQLLPADRSRLLGWQRDEIRALLYDELLGVINKKQEERTDAEKAAVNALAARIKQLRVDSAQYAINEYNTWKNNPCNYTPPPGFAYEGRQLCSAARLNPALAGPVEPPKYDEFQAYGTYRAFATYQDISAQKNLDNTARASAYFGGVGGGAIGGVIIAQNLSSKVVRAIMPFAGRAFARVAGDLGVKAGTAAAGASTGVARFIGFGLPVLIIVSCIVTAVLRGIDVANIEAIPGKLNAKLAEQQNAALPDLAEMIKKTVAGHEGGEEVYPAFLLMTLPDYPSTDPVPAPQEGDPLFKVHREQDGSTILLDTPSINFQASSSLDNESINQSLRLKDGWFINKYKDANNVEKERWKIRIEYMNWKGELWVAGRTGANFRHVRLDDNTQAYTSPEINYLDWSGNRQTASLLLLSLTIEALPVVLDRGHQAPGIDQIAAQTLPVALVNSGGQGPNTLSVTVNNAESATVNGVTISNLSVDSNGRVTASLKAECDATSPTFTLRVRDSSAQIKTSLLGIQLSPLAGRPSNPLAGSISEGKVGVPYYQVLSFIDIFAGRCPNVGNLGLSLVSGKLPPGLSLGAVQPCNGSQCILLGDGLSGTPATGGVYTFTVKKSYTTGDQFLREYTLNIVGQPAPLPSGALSWWSGERGIIDDLNRSHGTAVGNFGEKSFASGKAGLAFSFTGDNSAVQLPDEFFPFNAATNRPFTFETWFKTAAGGVIIGQQNTNPFNSTLLNFFTPGIYVGTDGKLRVEMFWKGSISPITSTNAVNDDDFHHVAVAYDGEQQIVYLDGVEMGRAAHSQQVVPLSLKYQFGTGYTSGWPATNNGWFNFNGLIDEPALYDRALTVEEVKSIYAAGNAGKVQLIISPFNPSCATTYTGVIVVKAFGHNAPYTFGLDKKSIIGTFSLAENIADGVLFNLNAGDYIVKIKDRDGRIISRDIVLTDPTAIDFTVTSVNPTCNGASNGSLTVNVTGETGALQYSKDGGNTYQSSNVFTNLPAGTYSVVVLRGSGCGSIGKTVTLTQPAAIGVTAATVNPLCHGASNGQITLNAAGGAGGFMYSKDNGASYQSSNVFSNLAAGTYNMRVKDAGGCFTNQTVTLSDPAAIIVTPPAITTGVTGTAFSQSFTRTGGVGNVSFSINSGSLPQGLVLSGNGTLSGTTLQNGAFPITVKATDQNGCFGVSQTYTLTINCPTVTLDPATLPNAEGGTAYSQSLSALPAGGNYAFTLGTGSLPMGLSLTAAGLLSGTPTQSGTFNFTVTATGFGSCTGSRSYTLVVQCPTITLTQAGLPGGTVGVAYNQSVTAAPSGSYSYTVMSGALPGGLSLNTSTGALMGTPTAAGTFNFIIQATTGSCSGSRSYTVTIGCPTIEITPASLPASEVGAAYNQTLNISPAGTYSYSLYSGSLPNGVMLNASSGSIRGAPAAAGTYSFTVNAQSSYGCSATKSYTLVINCPTITVNPTTLSNGTTRSVYNQALTATPAGGNYSYSMTSGALPAGITLNAMTGVLSGTPTVNGTFTFRITARGFGNCTGFRGYTLTINSAPCPTSTLPTSLPNGARNTLYVHSVVATPGGSYNYEVTNGNLPPGVTFYNSAGLLFGYPTAAGTYTFTIKATNKNNCTASQSYTVTINNAGIASAVVSDYDGDGRSDFAVWSEEEKDWTIVKSSDGEIRAAGWKVKYDPQDDALVSGDYDGDGKYDLAIFRRSTGEWLIQRSTDGEMISERWGNGTPAPADYDGDGRTDIAVWQSATGKWSIKRSSDGVEETAYWGASNTTDRDVPVVGDYDGDGKADFAVYRSLSHRWQIKQSSDGLIVDREWGAKGDLPLASDYDSDGKTDIAVWRAADNTWRVLSSNDQRELSYSMDVETRGESPLLGDYDGDGKMDLAIWQGVDRGWHVKLGGERDMQGAPSELEVKIPERKLRK